MYKDKRTLSGDPTLRAEPKRQRIMAESEVVSTLSEYAWKIKNFSLICKNGSKQFSEVQSDEFIARDDQGIESKWKIKLERNSIGNVTVCLSLIGTSGKLVMADFSLSVGNDDNPNVLELSSWSGEYKVYTGGDSTTIKRLMSEQLDNQRRTLLKDDALLVTARLRLFSVRNGKGWTRNLSFNLNVKRPETSFHSALSKDIALLFNDRGSADVGITCGDKTFYAHRLILSARSPVFKAMFSSGLMEARTGWVVLNDMKEDTAESILSYIYTGEVQLPKSISYMDLIPVAEKYTLTELKHYCFEKLIEDVTPANILRIVETMDLFCASDDVKNVVKEHCRRNVDNLLKDAHVKAKFCENPSLFGY